MKTKIIYTMGLLLLCSSLTFAQKKKTAKNEPAKTSKSAFYKTPYASRNSGSFDGDTHLISLSYGFPNTIDYSGYYFNDNGSSIGPATVRYEFPIRDEAGVGLSVSGATKEYEFYGGYDMKVTGIAISPLGFYHFNKLIPLEKLDVYAGIGASINLLSYKYDNDYDFDGDDSEVEVNPAGLIGARYYFTQSFSGLVEVGEGSFSIVRIGLSFRL